MVHSRAKRPDSCHSYLWLAWYNRVSYRYLTEAEVVVFWQHSTATIQEWRTVELSNGSPYQSWKKQMPNRRRRLFAALLNCLIDRRAYGYSNLWVNYCVNIGSSDVWAWLVLSLTATRNPLIVSIVKWMQRRQHSAWLIRTPIWAGGPITRLAATVTVRMDMAGASRRA